MQTKGNPVHCKNCNKLLGYYHVLVGEIKCKCGHTAQYQVLTQSFIEAVQNGEDFVHRAHNPVIKHKAIALA